MKYTIIDVGCRYGPRTSWLRPDVRIIGFEPDVSECHRLEGIFPEHKFIPFALYSERSIKKFWITSHPDCGSFYKPRQDLLHFKNGNGRFLAQRIVRTTELATGTLDAWTSANSVTPELIKLDTQGSELDVLKGGEHTLRTVAAVITEVEFNPLYEGQPLFGDVDRFLRDRGFELRYLRDVNECDGQLWYADAHYFRPERKDLAFDLDRENPCSVSHQSAP